MVSVSPWSIEVRRLGGELSVWTVTSEDTRCGGAWVSLLKNYDASPSFEFRGVPVRAVAAKNSCGNVG
ncbi:hypothetical protein [Pseudarthrobacter sp. S9]|uniref:hypothetical protein n=1 Tax=Pseudarthrobacter sp. S9 TaxID=3418421 RepID=UPI003D0190C0